MNIAEKIIRAKEDYDKIYQMRESMLDGSITEIYSEVTVLCGYTFAYRNKLIKVVLPNIQIVSDSAFNSCTNLNYVLMPKVTAIYGSGFNTCTSLKYIDLFNINTIQANVFFGCLVLDTIIIRNTQHICSLSHTNSFTNTPIESGTGYIYVPRNLIESYKTATNWVTFASQFRVLEDYTVDGTIEGELDWDKVNGGTA